MSAMSSGPVMGKLPGHEDTGGQGDMDGKGGRGEAGGGLRVVARSGGGEGGQVAYCSRYVLHIVLLK